MSECTPNELCDRHFEMVHVKLDRMDEAIRGNGKPGILLRLDRLEQDSRRQGRLTWLLVGGIVTGLATGLAMLLVEVIR